MIGGGIGSRRLWSLWDLMIDFSASNEDPALVLQCSQILRAVKHCPFTRLLEKKPPMQSRNQCLARFWSTVLALIPQLGWLKCDARTPRHIGRDRRSSSPAASTVRRSHGWPQRRPAEAEGCGSSLPRIALRGSSRGAYGKRESSSFCRNSRTSARPLVGGQHQRLAVARISTAMAGAAEQRV